MNIQIGDHAVDYATVQQKDKLNSLQLRMRQLLDQVDAITKEQNYQRVRQSFFYLFIYISINLCKKLPFNWILDWKTICLKKMFRFICCVCTSINIFFENLPRRGRVVHISRCHRLISQPNLHIIRSGQDSIYLTITIIRGS